MEAPELYHQAAGDHFMVEELLDFSNYTTPNLDVVMGNSGNLSNEDSSSTLLDTCNSSHPFNSLDHLTFPYDDLAELEWLSNFAEESFSSEDMEKLHLISGAKTRPDPNTPPTHGRTNNTIFDPELPVPAKARSKRSRAAPINWASRLLVVSAVRRRREEANREERKCLHCATDKTPQWRTGPMGPKTLCNACGVRYKSGRLVPEYRPAASPTFVLTKHSNSHRKVLELRRQKELVRAHQGGGIPYDVAPQSNGGDDFLIQQHVGPDFRQLI